MKKRILAMLLAALLTLSLLTACGTKGDTAASGGEGKLKVAFIIPGSISDGSFGTISYQGVEAVKTEDYIGSTAYIEGVNSATDAAKAARDYVAAGYDVVWAQSGAHGAAIMELASEFPDTEFVALATPPSDQEFGNMWFSLTECESAYYLVDALAAYTTKTGVVGYVCGRENPLYVACSKAYEEGAKSVNPDIRVLTAFTGDFNDPIKAKEAAVSQIEAGADLLVGIQSLGMTGVFAAAEESLAAGNKVWVVGKDVDQYDQSPDTVLTSVVFDYGAAMKNILSQIAQGNMAGSMPQSLEKGSVGLADFRGNVAQDVAEKLEALKAQLIAGEIDYTTQYEIG